MNSIKRDIFKERQDFLTDSIEYLHALTFEHAVIELMTVNLAVLWKQCEEKQFNSSKERDTHYNAAFQIIESLVLAIIEPRLSLLDEPVKTQAKELIEVVRELMQFSVEK